MDVPQPILDAALGRRLIPFIGAGFSKVFNLPSWSELIAKVARQLGFEPEIASLYGDFLQLAEFLEIQQNGLGSLRSELDRDFNSSTIKITDSQAHLLLPDLKARIIYTTNWDNLIERAFEYSSKPYTKVVAVDDLAKLGEAHTAIIKFHGDFSSDQSLVFTEHSYFERLSFESPLDIRLRSDMLANTLLFMGYSLSDINVRFMWFRLQKLLADYPSAKRREPFAYIVTAQRNPVFEGICRHSKDIGVIFLDTLDPQGSLTDLLERIVRHVNAP
jgi:hypothetical protein